MAKILIATEKPFAAAAVNGIREVIESSGMAVSYTHLTLPTILLV